MGTLTSHPSSHVSWNVWSSWLKSSNTRVFNLWQEESVSYLGGNKMGKRLTFFSWLLTAGWCSQTSPNGIHGLKWLEHCQALPTILWDSEPQFYQHSKRALSTQSSFLMCRTPAAGPISKTRIPNYSCTTTHPQSLSEAHGTRYNLEFKIVRIS